DDTPVSPARICASLLAVVTIAAACLADALAPQRAAATPGHGRHVAAARIDLASAGVYEMTVVVHTARRRARVTVRIGPAVHRVHARRHRAVIRQRVAVRGHEIRITARARHAAP